MNHLLKGEEKPFNARLHRLGLSRTKEEAKNHIRNLTFNDLKTMKDRANQLLRRDIRAVAHGSGLDDNYWLHLRDIAHPDSHHGHLAEIMDHETHGGGFWKSLKHLAHDVNSGVKKGLHIVDPALKRGGPITQGASFITHGVTETADRVLDE